MNNKYPTARTSSFLEWQEDAQKLFRQAKEDETLLINEEYKDVLADHELLQAEFKRITDEFALLLDRQPKNCFSWEDDKEILGEHVIAMAEMERINGEFLKKWGSKYEEYLAVMDALEKECQRAMAQTRSHAAYKKAAANLAKRKVGEES
jgi:hypothetical protein